MPRRPLIPILRAALVLLGGALLLLAQKPKRVAAPSAPAGYLTDVRADQTPPPGGHTVPSKPFPEQLTPDANGKCTDPDDVVMGGGCWAKMAKKPNPVDGCGPRYYRAGDACFAPVMKAPRLPTSISE